MHVSQIPIQQHNKEYKDSEVTETILKIIDNNKKLLNLKALKMKASGIYFGDNNVYSKSKYNTTQRNLNKTKHFKIHKIEEVAI